MEPGYRPAVAGTVFGAAILFACSLFGCGNLEPVGIRVVVGGTAVGNGGKYDFGKCLTADYLSEGTPAPITIENNGTAPLEVSSFSLSPEDPICFSFDPKDVLGTIGAQQSVSASMNFLPLSAEQQSCVLTIGNNTKSDSRYVINFTGTGVTKEVTGVNASSGSGSVILTWKDPEYNGFRKVSIQWAEDGGALSDPPATVLPGVGTFTASPLQNDHQYEFEIKTVDAQGAVSSGYLTRVQGSPTASTGLANVTILSADAQDRSTTISWSEPASSPTFAGVEISYQGVGSPQQAVKGTTSKTIYGLVNGTTYSFCLKSLYGAAGTSSGTTVDVTPRDYVPCHNVGNLAAWVPKQPGQILLSWTDPTDYDFYSVEVFWKTNTMKFICEVAKGLQQCTLTGLSKTTQYTFIVLTKDTSGNYSGSLYTKPLSPY